MGLSFDPGELNSNDDREVILKGPSGADLLGAALSASSLPVVIATDQVAIPVQKQLNTLAIAGSAFVARVAVSFSGTGFEEKLLIRNPAASGVDIVILSMRISPDLATTTNQLNEIRVKTHKNPTVTLEGSSVSTRNIRSDGSNSTNTAVFSDPTISNNGQSIGEVSNINTLVDIPIPYVIAQDDDLLIRIRVNDMNNGALIEIIFAEVSA